MAPRITLPGAGAIDLDLQDARILNVGLLTVEGTTTQDDVDASAAPRSYIDRGDLVFYDPTANYLTNQYVLFNNRIWFANRPVSGVEPGTSAADWTELSRNEAFIQFSTDQGSITADGHESSVTVAGGTGIATRGDQATETLTIDLEANLGDLLDVNADSPMTGYILQYNGTAWVPAEISGDGYNTISDGTNTSSVTTSRQTIEFSGTGAVNVNVTQDDNSSNLAISVDDATQTQAGLLSETDKRLLDDVRDGGWENNELLISPLPDVPGILLSDHLNMNIDSMSLDQLLRLDNLIEVEEGLRDHDIALYSDLPVLTADLAPFDEVTGTGTEYNVYIVTRQFTSTGQGNDDITEPARWYLDGQRPSSVSKPGVAQGILPNTINHFVLRFPEAAIDNVQQNNNYTQLYVSLDDNNRDFNDLSNKWFVIPGAAEDVDLNDLADVNVAGANAGEVLTLGADGVWTAVHPEQIEDHGGRAWNNTVTYRSGDIVSFDVSGMDRLYTSVTDSNQGNQPVTNGVVDSNWQEASILRLRDIANVDITSDPANNDLLIWNATESEWVVVTPEMVVQLTTAITEGDIRLDGRNEITDITIAGERRSFATTWRGEWDADQGANYRSLDVVIDSNNGSLFQLGQPTVPTALQGTRPSLARRDTNDQVVWVLISDIYFGDFNAAIIYDEGSIVHVESNYYLKIQDGQAAGAGTEVSDTTAWHNLSANTTYTAGTGITIDADDNNSINVDNPFSPNLPLSIWANTATYAVGDQVLHDGGSNVNSIYIANRVSDPDNPRPPHTNTNPPAEGEQPYWHLVRSGMVSVQGPDDTSPEGVTGNSTLRFTEGTGINITRSGTTFSFSQHGTGHSDADDFGPGWAFSFYDLRSEDSLGAVSGAVEESIGGFPATDILLISPNGVPVIQGTDNTSGLTNGQIYAFVTDAGAQNQLIFPGDPVTQRRIVYVAALFAGGTVWNLAILNADPRENTRGDLITATGASTARTISTTFTLYPLTTHHDTPSGVPADWATQGNTDDIPGNKLGALDDAKPANKADGTALGTIDPTWLPSDIGLGGRAWDATQAYTLGDIVTRGGMTYFAIVGTTTVGNAPDGTGSTEWKVLIDNTALPDAAPTDPTELTVFQTTAPSREVLFNAINDIPAGGRLEFTDRGNNIWDTTGFIEDPTADNPTATPIRTTTFNEGLLRFQLATAANLTLTVPNYPAFNWDQPVSGTVTATATRDALLDVDLIDLTPPGANITVSPSTGVGPWTVSYTDPSTITSPAGATSTDGGTVGGATFTATYSNDPTRMETAVGLGVTWRNTGLNVNNRNFGATRTFLQQYTSYNIPISCNNLSVAGTAVWTNGDTAATYNATPLINGGGTAAVGVGTSQINVPFTVSHNDTVANETVAVSFSRPRTIVPSATAFTETGVVTNQPNWNYPFFIFSQAGTPTDPVAVTIRDATQAGTATTTPSDAIGNRIGGISLTNSGSNVRFLYVAYPAASSSAPDYDNNQPLTVRISTTISGSSNISDVTVAEANHSSAPLNIFRDGGTAAEGEMYNWFRLRVGTNATVDLIQVL